MYVCDIPNLLVFQESQSNKLSSDKPSRSSKKPRAQLSMAESAVEPSEAQISQIETLREIHGNRCRVIRDIGQFSHVVEVKLNQSDCAIKFQLQGTFVPPRGMSALESASRKK